MASRKQKGPKGSRVDTPFDRFCALNSVEAIAKKCKFPILQTPQDIFNSEEIGKVWLDSENEGRAKIGIKLIGQFEDDKRPHITEEEKNRYTMQSIASYTYFQRYLNDFFHDFLQTPEQTIELVITLLNSDYMTSLGQKVYYNAVYILIPLMPHLTQDDCEKILTNLNNASFYLEPLTGEKAEYEPPNEELDFAYEGQHFLWGKYQKVFPYASNIFMLTYCKIMLTDSFWDNSARHTVAMHSIDNTLIKIHAPHFITYLIDLYSGILASKRFKYLVDGIIQNLNELGVFRKTFPFIKAVYKEGRVETPNAGHLKDFFPQNGIKPAFSDKDFLMNLSDDVWAIMYRPEDKYLHDDEFLQLKTEYIKELTKLYRLSEWKMSSDQVECNTIGCSVVRKFKDLAPSEGDEDPPLGSCMMRCSLCKVRYYCSVECQRKSWNDGHKIACRYLAAISKYKI
eukprot:TRINITY_DN1008_c0_g1_i1.p1 TRINITY_DN1008_c0_g1~~TRINITY_DN1008_c0_g1_i1.p1  ORF type:complete len:454 (+),score=76.95 TRINITY_DN1008_c0_g1_i1:115-1476(+)